jgi:hypothetical protein
MLASWLQKLSADDFKPYCLVDPRPASYLDDVISAMGLVRLDRVNISLSVRRRMKKGRLV